MVQGIGGIGSGSIRNVPAYQQFYSMYLQSGSNVSFTSWLQMKGYDTAFYQEIENYFETGDPYNGNDSKKTLNGTKYVSSGRTALFQGEDEDTFYEFDWATGSYTIIQDKDTVAEMLGLPAGTTYDTLNFEYGKVTITDYTFGNLEDGQDSVSYSVSGSKYGSKVSYVAQEFDLDYIFNALLMDESDPQYAIAQETFMKLCENLDQWLPKFAQEHLDSVAAEHGVDSAEYKELLKQYILEYLDQPKEWVEGHKHLEKTSSLTDPTFRSDGADGVGDGSSTSGGDGVPTYDKTNMLSNCGLLTAYSRGDKRTVESTNNSEGNRRKELQQMMDADLSTLANALAAELGDQYNDQTKSYIDKAVAATVAKKELIKTWSKHHGFLGMHIKTGGEYSIKEVTDTFLAEFDKLCKTGGKSEADLALDEEKKKKQKEAYKTLYNMNMKSAASEAGVRDSYQVVNVSSAAEIQAKAESDIIRPLVAQIRSKLAGKEINESDLTAILEYASNYALENPTEWASTQNNYVYTIDTNKVVGRFEEAVKKAVKQKGFDF